MQKLKQYWIIILLVILIIGVGFYWFQYRPYKARKDCAWKREHVDAIAAVLQKGTPTTYAEIDAYDKSVETCQAKYKNSIESWSKCGNLIDSSGYAVIGFLGSYDKNQWPLPKAPSSDGIDWGIVDNANRGSLGGGTEVSPLRADYQPAQTAQPAKDWWAQTTAQEYGSCLRGKGF